MGKIMLKREIAQYDLRKKSEMYNRPPRVLIKYIKPV